jgi:phage-related tail protein
VWSVDCWVDQKVEQKVDEKDVDSVGKTVVKWESMVGRSADPRDKQKGNDPEKLLQEKHRQLLGPH